MKYEQVLHVYNQGPKAVNNLVQGLLQRIEILEHSAKKNSKNSHLPPSTDGLHKPKATNLRKKTNRKSGGQPNHKGHTLYQVEKPDFIQTSTPPVCTCCQTPLENEPVCRKKVRQVFDVPPIELKVTQYEVERKICPNCLHINEGEFPKDVANPTQYGPNVKKLVTYFVHRQFLSLKRTTEVFRDVFGHQISQGTVNTILKKVSESLIPAEKELENYVLSASVAYCDETGMRNNGKTEWVHTFSTKDAVLQSVHPKRGKEAMEDIDLIPRFKGRIMHDCWASYDQFTHCQHSICNVHLIRDLKGIYEQTNERWANELIDLLLHGKEEKEKVNGFLDIMSLMEIEKKFQQTLRKASTLHPYQERKPNKRGKQKQTPARNLISRIEKYQDSIWAFLYHPVIPFDNNQAERDIRAIKLRMKISGSFRSEYGAQNYLRVASIFHTLIKQKKSIFRELEVFFQIGRLNILPTFD